MPRTGVTPVLLSALLALILETATGCGNPATLAVPGGTPDGTLYAGQITLTQTYPNQPQSSPLQIQAHIALTDNGNGTFVGSYYDDIGRTAALSGVQSGGTGAGSDIAITFQEQPLGTCESWQSTGTLTLQGDQLTGQTRGDACGMTTIARDMNLARQ